ncbi:MAG: CBS domain-containing protein [Gaiellaceae bacterium]
MSIADVMSTHVVQAAPGESVREAARSMSAAGIGSVAVCEGSRLVGIFTERDVLRLVAEGEDLDRVLVGDAMTTPVLTASPDADILAVARLMGERRVRHLPVVEGENLLGMIGIRDVLGALAEALWRTHDDAVHETARDLLAQRP